jgi:aminoglycoside phosphotransferase (APT) family kinase protein
MAAIESRASEQVVKNGSDEGPAADLDVRALEIWMRTHVPGFSGPLAISRFSSGQSNPTYLLQTDSRRYVLRRKPTGVLLPSAHAVDREYAILDALAKHSDLPVPKPVALCRDDSVIGAWFFVMTHLEGTIHRDPALADIDPPQRRAYVESMCAILARLHRLDWRAIGLNELGRPEPYVVRQIRRWTRQYQGDTEAGPVPALDRLIAWLSSNVPPDPGPALVHGDFRCDNVMFERSGPRIMGILDWELATIGDPLADFAYHLMIYRLPTLAFRGLASVDTFRLGLPSEEECVRAYCQVAGIDEIAHLDYYMSFCIFRLACIFHGIRGRIRRGTAASAHAQEYARHVETLADLAWAQAERAINRCPPAPR